MTANSTDVTTWRIGTREDDCSMEDSRLPVTWTKVRCGTGGHQGNGLVLDELRLVLYPPEMEFDPRVVIASRPRARRVVVPWDVDPTRTEFDGWEVVTSRKRPQIRRGFTGRGRRWVCSCGKGYYRSARKLVTMLHQLAGDIVLA